MDSIISDFTMELALSKRRNK